MAISPFMAAINQIADEKGVDKSKVIEAVEAAIGAAYRKDYGKPRQLVRAKIDEETGKFKIYQVFEVVDDETEIENPEVQQSLSEAKKIKKNCQVGEEITTELPYRDDFGRIAAQTAKQVVIQRLREAEREILLTEFGSKLGQLIPATIQQIEGQNVIVNLGRINGLVPVSEQVMGESYRVGQRLRFYIKSVEDTPRGPKILISRSDPNLIVELFKLEVPEVQAGTVAIKGVAREAGSRTKIAVWTDQESLDPVGSCVGQRGSRIQAVLAEIGAEKIDIILWDKDPKNFIGNALSPAEVEKVTIDEKKKQATIAVPNDQLSLAIGRNGQNVRLASRLVGYEIDILKDEKKVEDLQKSETQSASRGKEKKVEEKKTEKKVKATKTKDKKTTKTRTKKEKV